MSGAVSSRALPPDAEAPEVVEFAGKFVEVRRRGRWEYAGRPGHMRAAVILALDGGDVILVEQFRVPLDKYCLELPAGLIGDEGDACDALSTAAKELEEEAGYAAAHFEELGEFYSSPGMLSESFTLVKATGLTRVSEGGGTHHEDIVVHRVPVGRIADFVRSRREAGVAVDVKVLILLASGFLEDSAQ
jgi:ADP-ribose pyrophosphatase